MKQVKNIALLLLLPALCLAQTDHSLYAVKADSGIVRGRTVADTSAVFVVYKTLRVKVIKGINDTTLVFPGNVTFQGLVSGISGVTPTSYLNEDVFVDQSVIVNFLGSGVTATKNGDTLDVQINSGAVDSLTIVNLGFVAGPHTIDTDTNLDSTGIVALGFFAGPHTVNTNLDSLGIAALGFVAGPHTVGGGGSGFADSLTVAGAHRDGDDLFNSQLEAKKASDSDSLGALPATDYGTDAELATHTANASAHHIKTVDTNIDSPGVVALGFVAGPHAVSGDGFTLYDSDGDTVIWRPSGAHHTNSKLPGRNVFQFKRDGLSYTEIDTNGNITLAIGDLTVLGTNGLFATGPIQGPNVTSGANPGHTHTGSSISGLATGDVISGTFAAARISQGSVTQHEGAITHNNLAGFSASNHHTKTVDTTLDSAGVDALNFVPDSEMTTHKADANVHHTPTVDTNLDSSGVDALNFVPDSELATHGALPNVHHTPTVDTDTFVTNKDTHDHLGGDGAQIQHSSLGGVTANQHHALPLLSKTWPIELPSSSENIRATRLGRAATIDSIAVVVSGTSTPSVTWNLKHGTDRSAAGTTLFTVNKTTTSTTTGDLLSTGFNDNTLAYNEWIWFVTAATGGTVSRIELTAYYHEN